MDPNDQPQGRARGRGRGLYQHPVPFHVKDGHPGPQREPWSLSQGGPRPPVPQPGRQTQMIPPLKHSSSDESTGSKARGAPKLPGSDPGSSSDPSPKITYPDNRGDNLRGTYRKDHTLREALIYTRPPHISSKVGLTGQKLTLEANYFRLTKSPNWNIYLYRVDFSPDVMDDKFRRYLVAVKRDMLGGYLFDGTQLFLTRRVEGDPHTYTATGRNDDTPYHVTLRFASVVSMTEMASIQVQNLILRRAMDGLKLETVGRNKFDPNAAIKVPNLKLDIWPGYITSIRQHEEDILVCTEITHKVMRNETILDIIRKIHKEERDFKTKITQTLLGMTVLTKYNNKTYRIDEVSFDIKPSDTFETKNGPISYVDYYKNRYHIDIRDQNQPMLISIVKQKDIRGGKTEKTEQEVLLVPEICYATGLTEDMRSNFRTMREMAQYTRIGPAARIDRLLKFSERLRTAPESANHLASWHLGLEDHLVKIPARVLPYPSLLFGGDRKVATNAKADWTMEFRNNSMPHCIELLCWYLITPQKAKKEAEDFLKQIQKAANGMHFRVANPRIEEIANDNQTNVSSAINSCAQKNPQMIMCVVSTNSADRYATIKKRCCLDFGIPSQVLVHKTITPKDKSKGAGGLLSIATKVAIQMNAKLGGLPWLIDIPVTGLMTVGFDVCHDPKNKKLSWGAMVATMDLKNRNNEFFSAVNRHEGGGEISNFLGQNIAKAVHQFQKINNALPARIVIFRDGVGDGQIAQVFSDEVQAVKSTLKNIYEGQGLDEVSLMYMIVTKRVNTRLFFDKKNPDPGTCVDDVITLPERYDFYLISQSIREGTVSPTHFNIIHDTLGIPPDRIQMLTFRFTYFYFNWTGTVRVPALCQYAHKLAFLASQSLQGSPSRPDSQIEKTLYFL